MRGRAIVIATFLLMLSCLPLWAQGMRGHFQKVMLGVMLVGGATTIITAFYGMLGGGAAG